MATQAVSATNPTITKRELDLAKAVYKYTILVAGQYECLKAFCEEETNCWKSRRAQPGEIAYKSQKYVQRSEVLSKAEKEIQAYLPTLKERVSKQPEVSDPDRPKWNELANLCSDIATYSNRIIGRKSKFETAVSDLKNYQEKPITEQLATVATSAKDTLVNWFYGPSTAAPPEKPTPKYEDPLGNDCDFYNQFLSPFAKESIELDDQKSSEPDDLSDWTQASAWDGDGGAPKMHTSSPGLAVQESATTPNNNPSNPKKKEDNKGTKTELILSEPLDRLSKSVEELSFNEDESNSASRAQRALSADAVNSKGQPLSKDSKGSKSADDVSSLANESSASSDAPSTKDATSKPDDKPLSKTSGAARKRKKAAAATAAS